MDRKHRPIKKYSALRITLKTAAFLILSFFSIQLGMAGGSYLSNNDITFIRNIDTHSFKSVLDSSWPLINTIYNSGKASISFSGEIKSLVTSVFNFDLNNPLTVLNANSPLFFNYYNTGYQQVLAKKKTDFKEEYEPIEDYPEDSSKTRPDEEQVNKEDASSISFEEDEEKKTTPDQGVIQSGKITIQNQTKINISDQLISDLLKQPLKLGLDYSKKGPKVLIVHTHTTESYIKTVSDYNVPGISKWTNDPRSSVVRVGAEIGQTLEKKYGIEVIHSGIVHDNPDYNYAYIKSLDTVSKILKSYPTIKVVLDIHRDAMEGDKMLRAVTTVNGKSTAQVMFVIGTNVNYTSHTNWKENFKFSIKLQEKLNEKYPGLAKPIFISSNRYNQHVTNGAIIIEVGGDGNTLDEAIESGKYLADVINDVINAK